MIIKTVYVTIDGTEFLDEQEAREYEESILTPKQLIERALEPLRTSHPELIKELVKAADESTKVDKSREI